MDLPDLERNKWVDYTAGQEPDSTSQIQTKAASKTVQLDSNGQGSVKVSCCQVGIVGAQVAADAAVVGGRRILAHRFESDTVRLRSSAPYFWLLHLQGFDGALRLLHLLLESCSIM